MWITKVAKEFIKVTLDNGEEILTTPEHPYMLRDGSYILAEDLKEGQSLMPMYFNETNGYETVKFNSEARGWHSIYKLVADYFKHDKIIETESRYDESTSKLPYKVAIHHIDFNKKNNNPENLKIMTSDEHWNYHNSLSFENKSEEMKERIREASRQGAIRRNANPTERMIESRKENLKIGQDINCLPERKQQQSEVMKKVRESYYTDMSEEERQRYLKLLSSGIKMSWEKGCFNTQKFHEARIREGKRLFGNKDNQIHMMKCKMLKTLQRMIDDKVELTVDNYNEYRKLNHSSEYSKYFSSFEEMIKEFNLNHKVIKVEKIILEDTPVYDIKVKDWENFVVDAGVVLHNCPDWAYRFKYWAARNGYNSAIPDQWTNVRPLPTVQGGAAGANDQDTKGAGCKHVNLVISNLDWMMKVASVINNYIKWCRVNMERNYADYIFPQVYGVPYNKAIQLSLFDDPNDNGLLPSDQDTLNQVINKSLQGRGEKGQWAKGNEYRFQRKETETEPEEDSDQLHLNFGDEQEKELIIDDEEEEA